MLLFGWLSRLRKDLFRDRPLSSRAKSSRYSRFMRNRSAEHLESRALLSAPSLAGLGLVNDTGVPGDGITDDARIEGTLVDSDADSSSDYYVEVDRNNDGYADVSISSSPGSSFEYDLAGGGILPDGPISAAFRAIEEYDGDGGEGGGGTHYGGWQTVTIIIENPPPPQIVGLTLKNDTDIAGDFVTWDPRVVGHLDDPGGLGQGVDIEVDIDGDGFSDTMVYATGGSTFEFNAAWYNSFGSVTVAARTTDYESDTYETIYGDWQELTFQWDSVLDAVDLGTLSTSVTEGGDAVFTIKRPADFDGTIQVQPMAREKSGTLHPASSYYDFDEYSDDYFYGGPGSSNVAASVRTNQDNVDEYDDEQFEVEFYVSVTDLYYDSKTLSDIGTVTIIDDDDMPNLWLQRFDLNYSDTDEDGNLHGNTVPESDGVAQFNVMLSHPSEKDVELYVSTTDGTATSVVGSGLNSYTEDQDFQRLSILSLALWADGMPGMKNFSAGVVSMAINDDWWYEKQESFSIDLIGVDVNPLSTRVTVTIDDDVFVDPYSDKPIPSVPESASIIESVGLGGVVVLATLSNPSLFDNQLTYTTQGNPQAEHIATVGEDYIMTAGVFTIPASNPNTFVASELQREITVPIVDDTIWHSGPLGTANQPWAPDEQFELVVGTLAVDLPYDPPWDYRYVNNKTVITIVDEQSPPQVTISGPSSFPAGQNSIDLTFSFDQVYEADVIVPIDAGADTWLWWTRRDDDWCEALPPSLAMAHDGSWYDNFLSELLLTPDGAHDFVRTVSQSNFPQAYYSNSFFIKARGYGATHYLSGHEEQDLYPQYTSIALSNDTIYEDPHDGPTSTVLTVGYAGGLREPHRAHVLSAYHNGLGVFPDQDLSIDPFVSSEGTNVAHFEISAIRDLVTTPSEGHETFELRIDPRNGGPFLTVDLTVIDAVADPTVGEAAPAYVFPETGAFEVPADLHTGDPVIGFREFSGSATISSDGPFSRNTATDVIEYDGSAPLVSGAIYTVTATPANGDGRNGTVSTWTINVAAGGTPPVLIGPTSFEIVEGAGLGATIGHVSATDPDGDAVNFSIFNPDPDFAFTINPETGLLATTQHFSSVTAGDSFVVDLGIGAVTINVIAADASRNQSPVAVPDVVISDQVTSVFIDVVANDFDPESIVITGLQVATGPINGTAIVAVQNDVTGILYTPASVGTESFTYTVQDAQGNASTGRVTVSVVSVENHILVEFNAENAYDLQPYLVSNTNVDPGRVSYSEEPINYHGGWRGSLDHLTNRGYTWELVSDLAEDRRAGYVTAIQVGAKIVSGDGTYSHAGTAFYGANFGNLGDFFVPTDVGEPAGDRYIGVPGQDNFIFTGRSHSRWATGDNHWVLAPSYFPVYPESYREKYDAPGNSGPFDSPQWPHNNHPGIVSGSFSPTCPHLDLHPIFTSFGGTYVAGSTDVFSRMGIAEPAVIPQPARWQGFTKTSWNDALTLLDTTIDDLANQPRSHAGIPQEHYDFTINGNDIYDPTTWTPFGLLPAGRNYTADATNSDLFAGFGGGNIGEFVPFGIRAVNTEPLKFGSRYVLRFSYSDFGGNGDITGEAIVTVAVVMPNDPPVIDPPTGPFDIFENSLSGTLVGQLNATDPDGTVDFNWMITSGNSNADGTITDVFAIDNHGRITVNQTSALDFETEGPFLLTVQVSDVAAVPLTDTVSITVNLIDIGIEIGAAARMDLPENSLSGAVIGTVQPESWSGSGLLDYVVSSVSDRTGNSYPASTFSVMNFDSLIGEIQLQSDSPFDYEALLPTPWIDLTIDVTDTVGGETGKGFVRVNILDANDAPEVNLANVVVTLPEHTDSTTAVKVADINILDDALVGANGNQISFSGSSGDELFFDVVEVTPNILWELYVKAGTDLNFESKDVYTVRARA